MLDVLLCELLIEVLEIDLVVLMFFFVLKLMFEFFEVMKMIVASDLYEKFAYLLIELWCVMKSGCEDECVVVEIVVLF